MSHVPGPGHDQRGGEGSGHHQSGETTQSRTAPALPNTLWVQGWDTSCSGAGWKLDLGTASLGQRRGFPPAATQQQYPPPPRKPSSQPAHLGLVCWWLLAREGGWGLVPVGGRTHTPGRTGEDAGTPDGLETLLGPTAVTPALRWGSGEQLLGGGNSLRSLLWAGSVAHQSLALSSLSEYAPNKPREDVVPVAVGNEPGSRAREQTPSGRALPIAGKARRLGATSRAENTSLPRRSGCSQLETRHPEPEPERCHLPPA